MLGRVRRRRDRRMVGELRALAFRKGYVRALMISAALTAVVALAGCETDGLRSGKAMGHKRKEAVVTFRPVPHLPVGFSGVDSPNHLRIGFGPDVLQLDVDVNGPGDVFTLDRASLITELNAAGMLPYGEVLEGILTGDPLLSVRGDTAEDCWRIMEPVLRAWSQDAVPLEEYDAGSQGPPAWGTSGGRSDSHEG